MRRPLRKELQTIRSSVRGAITDLRQICGTLRPPTIDSLGLGSALQSYTYEWSKRTGIRVTLTTRSGSRPAGGVRRELSIFRIVQEGLEQRAQARGRRVGGDPLELTSPRRIMLSIADDGRGLPDGLRPGPAVEPGPLRRAGHHGACGAARRTVAVSEPAGRRRAHPGRRAVSPGGSEGRMRLRGFPLIPPWGIRYDMDGEAYIQRLAHLCYIGIDRDPDLQVCVDSCGQRRDTIQRLTQPLQNGSSDTRIPVVQKEKKA